MNKVTREHYPASRLPSDLREGIDPGSTVTVTVVAEESAPPAKPTLDEIWSQRRPPYLTAEQIDARVRRARDEWDE